MSEGPDADRKLAQVDAAALRSSDREQGAGPTHARTEDGSRGLESQSLGSDFDVPEMVLATVWAQRSKSSSSSSSAGGWGGLGLSGAAELEIPCIRSQSLIEITTSRAWLPLYWPTMPSSAM